MNLSIDQQHRLHDRIATAVRAELAAAEARAQEAQIAAYAAPGDDEATGNARTAATLTVDELRVALATYVVWGSDPVARMRDNIRPLSDVTNDRPFAVARLEAFTKAADALKARVDAAAQLVKPTRADLCAKVEAQLDREIADRQFLGKPPAAADDVAA